MAKGLVNESSLNSIAEAINVLNGSEGTYTPSEMGEAIIDAIPTETASGNPIHITDAAAYPAEGVVTTLEPVQDLHGYDKPWPEGGGKNKLNPSFIPGSGVQIPISNRVVSDHVIPVVSGHTYTFSSDNYTDFMYVLNSSNTDTLPFIVSHTYCGTSDTWVQTDITFTATNSGYVAVVVKKPDESGIIPTDVVNVKMQFEESATSTAYEPYSNECPISGHTGVELTRTGKNLLDDEFEIGKIDWTTGQNVSDASCIRSKNYSPIKGGLTYYFSIKNGSTDGGEGNIFWYDADKNFIIAAYATNVYPSTLTKIAPDNAAYVRVSPYASYGTTYNNDIGILYPATATTYEPYTNTAYGCEVDWTEGVLRVDKAIITYSSSAGFVSHASNRWYSAGLPSGIDLSNKSQSISNQAIYYDANFAYGGYFAIGSVGVYINKISENETIENFNSRLVANPFKICYPLATPLEIPLTPELITLLKGENNVWTDSGESEVEYKVDINSYIQKLIAAQATP